MKAKNLKLKNVRAFGNINLFDLPVVCRNVSEKKFPFNSLEDSEGKVDSISMAVYHSEPIMLLAIKINEKIEKYEMALDEFCNFICGLSYTDVSGENICTLKLKQEYVSDNGCFGKRDISKEALPF